MCPCFSGRSSLWEQCEYYYKQRTEQIHENNVLKIWNHRANDERVDNHKCHVRDEKEPRKSPPMIAPLFMIWMSCPVVVSYLRRLDLDPANPARATTASHRPRRKIETGTFENRSCQIRLVKKAEPRGLLGWE